MEFVLKIKETNLCKLLRQLTIAKECNPLSDRKIKRIIEN